MKSHSKETPPPFGQGIVGKALLLFSGNAFASLLSLLRNLLVARLISVEDYGIAATFAAAMAFVEMLSAFGLQQLVIQSKQANEKWQATLQGFQLFRGVLSALVLFLSAGFVAEFMGVPEIAWTYQLLALAPILNGLVNLDIYRLNRSMRYGPMVLTMTMPVLISLIAIWPLYLAFGDYRVMLFAVLLQAALMMSISILTSERAMRLRLDRSAIGQVMRFGWPLLINNILLFAVLNGEKILIGRELGMAVLGIFAMGFTLTLTPTMVLAKSVQSFFLPQLSAAQDDDTRFQPLARATIEANLFNGVFLVTAVVLLGELFIDLALGEKYAALVPLMVWLAILHAMRVFKAGGAVVSLARARTANAMIANSFRVLSLPLSWWVAVETGDLLLVIWIATGGEMLGVMASLVLTHWRARVPLAQLWPIFACTFALLSCAVLFAAHGDIAVLAGVPRWTFAVLCVGGLALCGCTMHDTKAYLKARKMEKRET